MIVRATTGRGFGGLVAYITHDAPTDDLRQPESSERVAWTHTENLPTDDPALSARIMAGVVHDAPVLKQRAGVSARGRKLQDPCLHLMLSWAPKENPTQTAMISATRGALKSLGLDGHQAVIAAHHDRDHRHAHAAVNRVSTEDGRAVNLKQSGRRLSAWAEQYERTHGGIQVANRVERRQAVVEHRKRPPMQRRIGPCRIPRLPAERRQWNRLYRRQRDNPSDPAFERRNRVRLSRRHRRIRPVRTAIAAGRTVARTAIAGTRFAVSAIVRGARSAGSVIARTAIARDVIDAMAMPLRDRKARKQLALARERFRKRARDEAAATRLPVTLEEALELLRQRSSISVEDALRAGKESRLDVDHYATAWLRREETQTFRETVSAQPRRPATPRHSSFGAPAGGGAAPQPTQERKPATTHVAPLRNGATIGTHTGVLAAQHRPAEHPRHVTPPKPQAPTATELRPRRPKVPPSAEDRPRSSRSVVEPTPSPSRGQQERPAAKLDRQVPVPPRLDRTVPRSPTATAPSELSRVEQLSRERKRIDQLFKDAMGAGDRQFKMEREARTAERELEQEIRKLPWPEKRALRNLERDHNRGRSR